MQRRVSVSQVPSRKSPFLPLNPTARHFLRTLLRTFSKAISRTLVRTLLRIRVVARLTLASDSAIRLTHHHLGAPLSSEPIFPPCFRREMPRRLYNIVDEHPCFVDSLLSHLCLLTPSLFCPCVARNPEP